MCSAIDHVCFGPKADIPAGVSDLSGFLRPPFFSQSPDVSLMSVMLARSRRPATWTDDALFRRLIRRCKPPCAETACSWCGRCVVPRVIMRQCPAGVRLLRYLKDIIRDRRCSDGGGFLFGSFLFAHGWPSFSRQS